MLESKNDCVTESEEYLKSLCDKLFLSLWSYPNVYRDQKDNGKGQGKELCDLLVVFGNDVIIFSDKQCAFKRTDNLATDWERWYKKTVLESAKQAWGAERWMRKFPGRLFLDKMCTVPFPIPLPNPVEMKVHIIVVSHAVSEVCREEIGGSGSLTLSSTLSDDMESEEFLISDLDQGRTFVHVLDDVTLDIVLNNLTTVSDFVSYLSKKEKLFRSGKYIRVDGEENLLGYYLENLNEAEDHDFPSLDRYEACHVPDDIWDNFQCRPERLRQLKADRISYTWDGIIEKFTLHIVNKTLYHSSHENGYALEKALRFLSSENRTRRRMLSRQLLELAHMTKKGQVNKRVALSVVPYEPTYVFLVAGKPDNITEDQYRAYRRKVLHANCMAIKYRYPSAGHIVGIAVGVHSLEDTMTEDLQYLDAQVWNDELQQEALELMKYYKIPVELPERKYLTEREYPEPL